MPASSASICCRWRSSRKRWCRLTRPRKASRSLACGARTLGCASAASLAGSVSPAISAWIIARPLRPMTSDRTDSSFMLASSSVFCRRCTWLAFSRTSCLRVRSSPRSSWISGPGTKLARISPCASSSANHVASFTSVLRPGTFFTCAAFASTSSKPPAASTCQTGFQ